MTKVIKGEDLNSELVELLKSSIKSVNKKNQEAYTIILEFIESDHLFQHQTPRPIEKLADKLLDSIIGEDK